MSKNSYLLLKNKKLPVYLKWYFAKKSGGVTPTLKNLYLGYSRQNTTTGKQLFNKNDLTGSNCTIEYSNGLYNATKTGSSPKIISNISLPAGDYTINSVGNLGTIIFYNDSTTVKSISGNHQYYNFTLDSEVNNVRFWFNGDSYSFDFDSLIIASGTYTSETMPTWEKYTGGIPAPNYDYPIEIEHLTGNVSIQAGNKVITFPLSQGQSLFADTMLTPEGILIERNTRIFTGSETLTAGTILNNLYGYFYSNSNVAENLTDNINVKGNYLIGRKPSDVITNGIDGICSRQGENRYGIYWRYPITVAETVAEMKQYLADLYNNNKPFKAEYKMKTPLLVPYTEAQQQAYIKLCKHFAENTDLNNYIVGG